MNRFAGIKKYILGIWFSLLLVVMAVYLPVKADSGSEGPQINFNDEIRFPKVQNAPIVVFGDDGKSVEDELNLEEDSWNKAQIYSDDEILALDAPVTEENVLGLLDSYCSDGAYILRNTSLSDSFLDWWRTGSTIISTLDTAVHEECHAYSFYNALGFGDYEAIYIGDGRTIQVGYTDVYRSSEMAATIPDEFRTLRYDTYVGNPDKNMASDIQGVYGLLNEFTAYCWGMNAGTSLYPYYKNFGAEIDVWCQYISDGENGCQAYAEFQYYILNYLIYAKENYPDIYNGIMNNTNFIAAYQQIDTRYQNQINQYRENLKDLVDSLQTWGHMASYDEGRLTIDGYTFGLCKNEYNTLISELNNSKYDEIKNALGVEVSLEEALKINSKEIKERNDSFSMKRNNSKKKVTNIYLSGISRQIAAGKKITLKATVKPVNAKNKKLLWYSSNPKVATVTPNGIVTIRQNTGGKTVIITAKATDGSGVKGTYKIKSMKGVVKKVSVNGAKTVKAGKSLKLKAKVTATKGANKKLQWTSSNTKYATVTSSGKVKTFKAGKGKKVKITVMATDGSNKKKTVMIKIK